MRLYVTEYTCYGCGKTGSWPWDEMLPCPMSYTCPCLKDLRHYEHVYWKDDSTKIIDDVPYTKRAEYMMKHWKMTREEAERQLAEADAKAKANKDKDE